MPLLEPRTWNFDIDRYLNRVVPAPPWRWIPYPVAHFLGYRRTALRGMGNVLAVGWAIVGVFCSIVLIELACRRIPAMEENGVIIIASFGAAAVLEFYAIESPLAQPRNLLLGQTLSTTVGVGVSHLFALGPRDRSLRWLGGAVSCAAATALMGLTHTVHPPAGATALLAVVDDGAAALGWLLIPVVLLGCAIMLATALLVNNVQRRFPSYWWTADALGGGRNTHWEEEKEQQAPEVDQGSRRFGFRRSGHSDGSDAAVLGETRPDLEMGRGEMGHGATKNSASTATRKDAGSGGAASLSGDEGSGVGQVSSVPHIILTRELVVVSPHVYLSSEERMLLETISSRL